MPRLDNKPKFYYHITTKDLDKKKVLTPYVLGDMRPEEEPDVPRICVGPSVPHCLISITISPVVADSVFIYRTFRKVKAHYPFGVFDSGVTKEKWILKPTTFIQIGSISLAVLSFIDDITDSLADGNIDRQKHHLRVFSHIFHENGELNTWKSARKS